MILSTVLGKIISIFIIMIVGILCWRSGIIDDASKEKFSRLSTQIVSPMVIFMSFQIDYDRKLLIHMGILFGMAIAFFLMAIAVGRIFLREKAGYDIAVERFAVTYANFGYMGLPLAEALLGNTGVIYMAVFIAVYNLFVWSHGIMLLDGKGFQVKKLINPSMAALVLGLLCLIFQIKIPESPAFAMNSIAAMNTPLAMILSGAIVAQIHFGKIFREGRLFWVVLLRQIVSAGIFCGILRFIPIEASMKVIAAVAAACPVASMTITLSIIYHRDSYYATEIFTVSTLLCIVTLPLCLFIAGAGL